MLATPYSFKKLHIVFIFVPGAVFLLQTMNKKTELQVNDPFSLKFSLFLVSLLMMLRRQEFIALPIHGLDEVSVQFMAQLVNDAGDPRPATIKRIRGGELIDLPL